MAVSTAFACTIAALETVDGRQTTIYAVVAQVLTVVVTAPDIPVSGCIATQPKKYHLNFVALCVPPFFSRGWVNSWCEFNSAANTLTARECVTGTNGT